jgi:hypothetical protein
MKGTRETLLEVPLSAHDFFFTTLVKFEVVKLAKPYSRKSKRYTWSLEVTARYQFPDTYVCTSRAAALARFEEVKDMAVADALQNLGEGPVSARREYSPQWLA